jgi:hypothetical protein
MLALAAGILVACAAQRHAPTKGLRFEVSVAPGLLTTPTNGRLLLVLGRMQNPEPRFAIGQTGMNAPPLLGWDVSAFGPSSSATVEDRAAIFPIDDLHKLPAGDYWIQAVLHVNRDLCRPDAPGNLYSTPVQVRLGPAKAGVTKLVIDHRIPPEEVPADTDDVKFIKLKSELLSKFHGRPIYLRAGVILPRDFEKETTRRYPLWVNIGGFGTRYTAARGMTRAGSWFRRAWTADDAPRMLLLFLDGAGPYGDPYQVNSANNGPYGDAVVKELIPYVEGKYRGIGKGYARVLKGGSTGGWVALALQVFYPDFFNGAWAGYPDGVDFRAYQLVNIYSDKNAYVDARGAERPSKRTISGSIVMTMRQECGLENVLGRGDSYTTSGGQWGSWNAVYGPRGADGRPVPVWDPKTGEIDHSVAEQWKKYDLRLVLEKNWKMLGPKLRGKLHIWVGEADDYYLNNAVHLLDAFLTRADPPYEGSILYGPGKGHGWEPYPTEDLLKQMAAAIEKGRQDSR